MTLRTSVTIKRLSLTLVILLFSVTTAKAGFLDFLFGSDYTYNVLFYPPSGKEEFLGNVSSKSACGDRAYNEAVRRSLQGRYDYLCCKSDGKSFCLRKER